MPTKMNYISFIFYMQIFPEKRNKGTSNRPNNDSILVVMNLITVAYRNMGKELFTKLSLRSYLQVHRNLKKVIPQKKIPFVIAIFNYKRVF